MGEELGLGVAVVAEGEELLDKDAEDPDVRLVDEDLVAEALGVNQIQHHGLT